MLVYNAATADSDTWREVPLACQSMVARMNVPTQLALVDRLSCKMAVRGRHYATTKTFDLVLGEIL